MSHLFTLSQGVVITNESAESISQIKTSVKLDHIECRNFQEKDWSNLSLDIVISWDHFFFVNNDIIIFHAPGCRDTLTAVKNNYFYNTFHIGMNRFQEKEMDRIAQVQFEEENYVKTTSENLETEAIDNMFDVVTYTDDALHKI